MAKILIIEDDSLMSRLYQKAFASDGYEVEFAFNGEEGLKKAKSSNPTLILLDIMMPKMNGVVVLEELKKNAGTKAIPVIMLTNLSDEHIAEDALHKGAVKYIVKGDNKPKAVVDMVKEILSGYTRHEVPKVRDK